MNGNTEKTRAVVEQMYRSALAGDLAGATETMIDDIVVYEPSFLPWGGVTHDKQGFIQLLAKIATYISMPDLKLEYLVVDGDIAVSYMRGKTLAGEVLVASERSTVKNGKIVEISVFYHEAGKLIAGSQR